MQQASITSLQPEEELIFACLRQELSRTETNELVQRFEGSQLAWEAIFNIGYRQGVAPLLYQNLGQCRLAGLSVPPDILKKFELAYTAAQNLQTYRTEKLNEILGFFASANEDVLLLKGAAYAQTVFRDSAVAASADIDLLIKSAPGRYSQEQLQFIDNFYHAEAFEIDFQQHHDLDLNRMLSLDYRNIWQDARSIELFGFPCFIMGPEDLLIFACVNSCRKRFFHLKALLNVAETIRSYPDIDWSLVASKTKSYRCENMTYAALLAASCTVGCRIPEDLAARFNIGSGRLRLIRYLVVNMSFSDLADRSLFIGKEGTEASITNKDKWNRSGLLLLAVYSGGQLLRRLQFLLRRQLRGISNG